MTPTETSFLLWVCGILLAILAFIGALAVSQLIKMATDLNEIKVFCGKMTAQHEALVEKVDDNHLALERRVYNLEKQKNNA